MLIRLGNIYALKKIWIMNRNSTLLADIDKAIMETDVMDLRSTLQDISSQNDATELYIDEGLCEAEKKIYKSKINQNHEEI